MILVACEFSGTVRDAFIRAGHDAMSCDLLPSESDAGPHYQGDVRELLGESWDIVIAHPDCTYLTNSGVRWLYEQEGRVEKMRAGAEFFKMFLDLPGRVAVENPIMHGYATEIIGRKQDQVIQPWMHGHAEKKGTGLWLKNLPLLTPSNVVSLAGLSRRETDRVHYASPGPDRWKVRARTYTGIADAMARQWGALL